ncbi:protein ADP-ribosyltransferase PARP3 [Trifolium repens]|nr:protein ADP-ribosyltransferase PARP3 [Trifolium repens]
MTRRLKLLPSYSSLLEDSIFNLKLLIIVRFGVNFWIQVPIDKSKRPQRDLGLAIKPFTGMMISLMGRLNRTHQYWKTTIEKHGGKVANSIIGATCLVASPAERERGGTSKLAEAMERGVPVVREAWLTDSIEKQEPQPLGPYDLVSDLSVAGKGIPWDKQDPGEEAIESLSAELYGKRGVYKDSHLIK